MAVPSAYSQVIESKVALRGRKLAARNNPGSFSLVGDVYPDRKNIGNGRIGKLADCFPQVNLDDPEDMAAEMQTVTFTKYDLHFLFSFSARKPAASAPPSASAATPPASSNGLQPRAPGPGAGGTTQAASAGTPASPTVATTDAAADPNAVRAGLQAAGARFVSIRASGLHKLYTDSAKLKNAYPKGICKDQIENGAFVVTDAIGATTMDFDLVDERGASVAANVPVSVISSLFTLGLSGDRTKLTTTRFDKPVYFGFGISQWDKSKKDFKLIRVGN